MFSFIKEIAGKISKIKSTFPPLREVLSEDGVGSYSRVTGFVIIVSTLGWVTFLVIKNHAFPDMTGPTAFMAGGQTQYGLNQMKRIAAAVKTGVASANTPVVPGAPGEQNADQS